MNCVSVIFNDIDKIQWLELVEHSSTANWFQTCEAYQFFASLPDLFEPFVYGVHCVGSKSQQVDDSTKLRGVCVGYITKEKNPLKQYLTRRAIITGGPMLADDITDEELTTLLQAVKNNLKRKAIYIETRNFNDYLRWKDVFVKNDFDYVPHLNFHNDTTSLEIINNNLGKSRKRDVKKAEKNGSAIIEHPDSFQLREYYDILNKMYKEKVHTPLFPFEFFEQLSAIENSRILLISDGKKITEGVVCVQDNHTMYEWFACGVGSHTFATYSAMLYASKSGKARYDMMGAGKPNEAYGVRDFKSQFGGKLVEYGRFLCISRPLQYKIGKLGVRILKRKK